MIEQSVSSGSMWGRAVVTTRGSSALEMLQAPGLAVERTLELSGQWFNELCLWLQSPIGALGPIGWPMVLIPEIIDSRYRLGDTALHVYQRVEWDGPIPRGEFTASGHVGWVSARDGSLETGVVTRARLGDEDLARSLLVARMRGDLESYGLRDLPARPELDLASLARRRTLVVDEATIRHFADLAGTRYPIHDDERYAWARGYPTILVQGLVLFMTNLHFAGVGPSGRAEMWFRRAVPAGSLLEACQSIADPTLWVLRLVGGGEVAAVARISSSSSSSGEADDRDRCRGHPEPPGSLVAWEYWLNQWPDHPIAVTRANAADGYPRPLTPLSQDLILTYEEAGVRKFYFETLGVLTPAEAPDPYMQAFYGLVYLNADQLAGLGRRRRAAPARPCTSSSSASRPDPAFVPPKPKARDPPPGRRAPASRVAPRTLRLARDVGAEVDRRRAAILAARPAGALGELSDPELAAWLDRLDGLQVESWVTLMTGAGLGSGFFETVRKMLVAWAGDTTGDLTNRLHVALGGNESAEAGRAVRRLAEVVRREGVEYSLEGDDPVGDLRPGQPGGRRRPRRPPPPVRAPGPGRAGAREPELADRPPPRARHRPAPAPTG